MSQIQTPAGIIGVVHLHPMPGDPRYDGGGFAGVIDAAAYDLDALLAGGVRSVIIENFGSTPFPKGTKDDPVEPHVVALMARVVAEAHERDLICGVNCLRNDAYAAVAIAAVTDACFVRINVHTGAYVTDQGMIEGEAARTLRYRKQLGANAAILADVFVKHAAPLVESRVGAAVRDCLLRGHADAVIVTGAATGSAANMDRFVEVLDEAGDAPVYVGSGVNPQNASHFAKAARGAIVGTWTKHDGVVTAPVDSQRVRQMVDAWAQAGGAT